MILWEAYDEDEDCDDEDDDGFGPGYDEEQFDCGMDKDGACSMAGSEDCDFECPYRAQQLRTGRK
jgi:hypothetical protein